MRFSAYSPVKRAFPPGRAGRFDGTEYRPPLHGRVFSRLGTTIRVRPVGRDVVAWFFGFLTRRAVDAKRPLGSKTPYHNRGTPSQFSTGGPELTVRDGTPVRLPDGGLFSIVSASSHG